MTDQEIDEISKPFCGCWSDEDEAALNYRTFARALLSRAIPEGHVVVPGWRPIESAPKDGTRFLALHDGRIDFWHWQDFKDGGKSPVGWRNFIYVYPEGGNIPTLWMPLPAAPANKEG